MCYADFRSYFKVKLKLTVGLKLDNPRIFLPMFRPNEFWAHCLAIMLIQDLSQLLMPASEVNS